jgi:hypothetical protein
VANMPAGTQHDWNQVFGNYTAAVDNPGCCDLACQVDLLGSVRPFAMFVSLAGNHLKLWA